MMRWPTEVDAAVKSLTWPAYVALCQIAMLVVALFETMVVHELPRVKVWPTSPPHTVVGEDPVAHQRL